MKFRKGPILNCDNHNIFCKVNVFIYLPAIKLNVSKPVIIKISNEKKYYEKK